MPKAEKEKAAKVSDKEAEKIILSYLEKQNRPFNALTLYENLHGAVGKTQANKLLTSLAESKKITAKEFGKQKIFWRNQEGLEIDKEGLAKLEKQIEQLEKEREPLNEECKSLSAEIHGLTSNPTNQEADVKIAALTKENTELQTRLKNITENQVVISPEEKKQAEKQYEVTRQQWRKRKRICKDICSHLEEGSGKRFKDFQDELGLQVDEDFGISLDKDETTRLKKGEI